MIPWKNPNQLPEPESAIWVMRQRPNKNGALSVEIIGMKVRKIETEFVSKLISENEDWLGRGWIYCVFKDDKAKNDNWKDDRPLAWCYVAELNFPPWIEHRSG